MNAEHGYPEKVYRDMEPQVWNPAYDMAREAIQASNPELLDNAAASATRADVAAYFRHSAQTLRANIAARNLWQKSQECL